MGRKEIINQKSQTNQHKTHPEMIKQARSKKDKIICTFLWFNQITYIHIRKIKNHSKTGFYFHRYFPADFLNSTSTLMLLTGARCNIPSVFSPQNSRTPRLPWSLVCSGCHSAATGCQVCHQPGSWKASGSHLIQKENQN